jgi:hypothetical protein
MMGHVQKPRIFLSREVRKQRSMVISDHGSFAKLRIFFGVERLTKLLSFRFVFLFIVVGCGGLLGNDFTFLTTDLRQSFASSSSLSGLLQELWRSPHRSQWGT